MPLPVDRQSYRDQAGPQGLELGLGSGLRSGSGLAHPNLNPKQVLKHILRHALLLPEAALKEGKAPPTTTTAP